MIARTFQEALDIEGSITSVQTVLKNEKSKKEKSLVHNQALIDSCELYLKEAGR